MEMLTNKIFVMINQKIFSMEIVNESKWIEKHISVQLNNEIKIWAISHCPRKSIQDLQSQIIICVHYIGKNDIIIFCKETKMILDQREVHNCALSKEFDTENATPKILDYARFFNQ